jgi:methyl-accepting chemotaxis protein
MASLSVRTKPTATEVQATDAVYQKFRDGWAQGLAFHRGLIVRTGLMRWASAAKILPTAWRVCLPMLLLATVLIAVLGWSGLGSDMLLPGGVVLAAQQVASKEIAAANSDLFDRTEQTASNLEQTAAAMEQQTATVRQNSDTAQQASQLAHTTTTVASRGGEAMGNVVSTMALISEFSHKIADIISVIDGIAFQTNILALNAAVEAARAGEQGRGFAVVASEVRSLAGRSAASAKEIKALIDDSVGKVASGSRLVADAGSTMSEVVHQVQQVNQLITEITSASKEQALGIGQVGQAVAQLDEMTQQNAAMVEQSSAAATSLSEQARRLMDAVKVFSN